MKKMTVKDVDFHNQRVLIRVDFNVPLSDGTVADDTRIRAAVPTIQYILAQHPRSIVLMSHLGRPKGERKAEFSLQPVVPVLSDALGKEVAFVDDCIGDEVDQAIEALPEGGILLLENTRFYGGETKNDPELAEALAKHGDIFVNDAFGTAHRAHASNVGVSELMTAVAGLLMEKEIDYLANTIDDPERPFVAILGGAKVSDKIGVIESLLTKADKILIGGGMANTFFKAQGNEIGNSLVETESLSVANELLDAASDKLVLPVDAIVGDEFDNDANQKTIRIGDAYPGDNWSIYDIGPDTIRNFSEIILDGNTIVWNGPMGVFEMPNFANGTFQIAEALAEATGRGATTIVGGGDSASAVEKSGLADRITHISTGGGASLEMLEGKVLPGLAALNDR